MGEGGRREAVEESSSTRRTEDEWAAQFCTPFGVEP